MHITKVLGNHHVSYEGIKDVLALIYPRSRETIRKQFNREIDGAELPEVKDVLWVHYDEQHPKNGRCQKFRLTLLDVVSKQPIADELFDDKSTLTIEKFLATHLDPEKPIFIVTDHCGNYPGIFDRFFLNGYHHQLCLLHLDKLIVNDFPRNCSLEQEYLKYRLLNIFYDRTKEVQYLKRLVRKDTKKKGKTGYNKWRKQAKKCFRDHLHKWENRRRRRKETMKMRVYNGSVQVFNSLIDEYDDLPTYVQKRLDMISKHWKKLMMFHNFKDAPATNNPIENYYSCSLKTHQKRQYTSDEGIEWQMKLSRLKRAGLLKYEGRSLFELFRRFLPFRDAG